MPDPSGLSREAVARALFVAQYGELFASHWEEGPAEPVKPHFFKLADAVLALEGVGHDARAVERADGPNEGVNFNRWEADEEGERAYGGVLRPRTVASPASLSDHGPVPIPSGVGHCPRAVEPECETCEDTGVLTIREIGGDPNDPGSRGDVDYPCPDCCVRSGDREGPR